MEEDRDLEELKKAIDADDKERAKIIATTLLKQRSKLGNPNHANPSWLIVAILAVAALSPVIVSLWEIWMRSHPKSKREVYVGV
mgnify:CR=1 FL=1